MTGYPLLAENVPDTARGGLGLEVFWNNSWVDVTEKNTRPIRRDSRDSDDGFLPDFVMEFNPLLEEMILSDPAGWEVRHNGRGGCVA